MNFSHWHYLATLLGLAIFVFGFRGVLAMVAVIGAFCFMFGRGLRWVWGCIAA
jgi:hypothetical protein